MITNYGYGNAGYYARDNFLRVLFLLLMKNLFTIDAVFGKTTNGKLV